MERILTNIRHEANNLPTVKEYCSTLLNTLPSEIDNIEFFKEKSNLECVLNVFKQCITSDITKLNTESIDLLRVYTRNLNEVCDDSIKVRTLTQVLRHCQEVVGKISLTTSLDLFTFITEIGATFNTNLALIHVIDIIEMCHFQIEVYMQQKGLRPNPNNTSILNLGSSKTVSTEDKLLSAIYLTASQACHYFVKQKISQPHPPVFFIEENFNYSRDFSFLILYLSKKLETKVIFYRHIRWNQEENCIDNYSDAKFFMLIKIFNCLYLKCIHYVLLTIPDAWTCINNPFIDIICTNLIPLIMDILTPLSNIHYSNLRKRIKNLKSSDLINTFLGRGSEKLHLGKEINYKDKMYNSFHNQERQYLFKISMELLRLFGLENSMRPLMESLYHRVFLLPPLHERFDTLIYMQEIFKNQLLVLILMSNPVCLYGPSSSHSLYSDLFQIFVDSILEAFRSDDTLLNQLSMLCLVTLFNTLSNLANFKENSEKNISDTKQSILSSPSVIKILNFVEKNSPLFEKEYSSQQWRNRRLNFESDHYRAFKFNPRLNRHNFLNMKKRICGYDLKSFEDKLQTELLQKNSHQSSYDSKDSKNLCSLMSQQMIMKEDYQDKLKSLMRADLSSTDSNSFESHTVEHECRKFENIKTVFSQVFQAYDTFPSSKANFRSLQDIRNDWIFRDLEKAKSDSKLNTLNFYMDLHDANMFDNIENSVFDSSSDTLDDDSDDSEDRNDINEADFVLGRRTMFPFDDHYCSSSLSYFERALAQIFLRKLRLMLPDLINCRNLILVDEFIQLFSSNYCKDLYVCFKTLAKYDESKCSDIQVNDLTKEEIEILLQYSNLFSSLFINADGIYLTTYSCLLLNLKLIYLDYYDSDQTQDIPQSEKAFIDDIFNNHITIYLSTHFLAEVYQNVLANNFLQSLYESHSIKEFNKIPLIKFLHDIDVLDINNPNSFKLSDYARLEQMAHSSRKQSESEFSTCQEAAISCRDQYYWLNLIVKQFLGIFWNSFMNCFQHDLEKNYNFANVVQLVGLYNSTFVSSVCYILNCESKHLLARFKNHNVSIQTLQLLLDISLKVGFYSRLDVIYRMTNNYIIKSSQQEKNILHDIKTLKMRRSISNDDMSAIDRCNFSLTLTQIVSIKNLLTKSGRVGSYCPRVWCEVFNLCKFVTDLENLIFRSSHSSLLSRARISISTILKSNSMNFNTNVESSMPMDYYQNMYDFKGFKTLPGINEAEFFNLESNFDIFINKLNNKNCDLELKSKELEQLVEYLSLFASQIFESIALKCNLSLVSNFVVELCDYSKAQLIQLNSFSGTVIEQSNPELKSLMLFRLVEVVLRFVRNGRPLLHFMKVWPTVATHLIYASTHKESSISKKAVISLHDIINAFLNFYNERDFFNFNETLFKPYEKLFLYELSDSDETQQELLLNSICEFVEGASNDIRSGWRSIFKALRGLRFLNQNLSSNLLLDTTRNMQILTDTFEAFLRTENMHVLAYASVDFILCLFHLIRSISMQKTDDPNLINKHEELFIVFLKYLQKFSKILRSIYDLPEDSLVIALYIQTKKSKLIDLDLLKQLIAMDNSNVDLTFSSQVSLSQISKPISLLQIWCLLLDEYATTIRSSQIKFRPMLLEFYFTLIQTIADMNDMVEFSIYCCNHIIVPLMQNLLRETLTLNMMQGPSDTLDEAYMFLKSWLEIFDHLIIKYILSYFELKENDPKYNSLSDEEKYHSIALLLHQILLIYMECLSGKYHDLISILALSSIRRLLLSLNQILTSYFWNIVINCFKIGHYLTIGPLKVLIESFSNLPADFSSDLNRIKIMTNRSSDNSFDYMRKRASQIFFVNPSQIEQLSREQELVMNINRSEASLGDNRVFNIIVETFSGIKTSFSYNLLITQVHNHLALLQIISSVLTFNVEPRMSDLMKFLYEDFQEISTNSSQIKTFPVLNLKLDQYRDLSLIFKQSFCLSMDFDSRPGLKYLIGHMCKATVVPNLYQISSLVWCMQFSISFFLCSNVDYQNEEALLIIDELFNEISNVYCQKSQFLQNSSVDLEKLNDLSPFLLHPLNVLEDNEGLDNGDKVYCLASFEKVGQVMKDYRKTKQKQILNNESRKKDNNEESKINQGNEFLLFDSKVFLRIWSDILANCINMHTKSDWNTFAFMLVHYKQLVKDLVMQTTDANLRTAISAWIDRTTDHVITNIDHNLH